MLAATGHAPGGWTVNQAQRPEKWEAMLVEVPSGLQPSCLVGMVQTPLSAVTVPSRRARKPKFCGISLVGLGTYQLRTLTHILKVWIMGALVPGKRDCPGLNLVLFWLCFRVELTCF